MDATVVLRLISIALGPNNADRVYSFRPDDESPAEQQVGVGSSIYYNIPWDALAARTRTAIKQYMQLKSPSRRHFIFFRDMLRSTVEQNKDGYEYYASLLDTDYIFTDTDPPLIKCHMRFTSSHSRRWIEKELNFALQHSASSGDTGFELVSVVWND